MIVVVVVVVVWLQGIHTFNGIVLLISTDILTMGHSWTSKKIQLLPLLFKETCAEQICFKYDVSECHQRLTLFYVLK